MMRADDGRIDHLQSRVAHSTSSERLQDHIPDAAVGPPSKLPKDRIPVAELLRQVAPRRASSHQPKDRVEHTTMVARRPTAAAYQERLEIRPLIVRHQSANHRRSPQRAALNQFAILASIDLSTRPSVKSIASEALLPHTAVFREGRGVGFICAARPKNICHFLTERRDGILVISYATEK